jgi:AraC-like DNA-binding protein
MDLFAQFNLKFSSKQMKMNNYVVHFMIDSHKIPIRRAASTAAICKAQKIKIILDKSPDNIPTLSMLEKEFSLSKGYLQSGFRNIAGMTIGEYGKQVKLKFIKELLKDYSLTLDTIAIKAGYNGGEALCRFFKLMEGINPGLWRKQYFNSECK